MPLARKLISSFYCYVERLLVLGVEFPFGRTRRESTRDEAKKKGKKEKKEEEASSIAVQASGKGGERKKTCSKGKKSSCSRAFFVLLSIEHERKKRTHDPSHGYVGNTFFFLLLLTSHVHVLHILHLSPSRATAPRSVPFSFRGGARSVYLEYGLLFLGTVLTFLPRVNVFVHVPDVGIRSPSTSRLSVFCRCFGDE